MNEKVSIQNVSLTPEQLFSIIEAMQNDTATDEQIKELINNSNYIEVTEKYD